jgi:Stress responsive A/B Barrel Domain
MAAVQRYAEHPAHVDVVQRAVAPIRAARLAVDVEVPA